MPVYRNRAQKIYIYAQYLNGTVWTAKTGDAANITAMLSKDGAAAAATNDVNPSEIDAGDNPGWYAFDMLAAETNCDFMLLTPSSVTAGVTILPVGIYTSAIPTSVSVGTCQAGSTTTYATLAATEPAVNDYYNGCLLTIITGTGSVQARLINDYIGASKNAVVNDPFITAPDATSGYMIQPFSGILLADTGTAAAGGANTITLSSSAIATANTYIGHTVFLCGGVGIGQARVITAYTALRVATVYPDWTTQPNNTSIYMILPVSAINAPAIMDVACVGTKTLAQCVELVMAMCRLAKNTGFAAGPCVVRNIADTADLATITFDANGNVTNVVIA